MYTDHSPVPNLPTKKVVVIEESDKPYSANFADEVITTARAAGATSQSDGEIFWIVFANEPKRAWDMTEGLIRSEFRVKAVA